jgi:hypothetical protein
MTNANATLVSTSACLEEFPFIWWSLNDPTEIYLTFSSPELTDENGEHPGLWITFSSNRRSANYHPANFNRCVRYLTGKGLPAPAIVPESNRRLSAR